MEPRHLNEAQPVKIPTRPAGSTPVIARFVESDLSESWWPAIATRWSGDGRHVLVTWLTNPVDRRSAQDAWLRTEDVAPSLRVSAPNRPTNADD